MFGLKVIGNGVSKWGDMYGSKENGKEKTFHQWEPGRWKKTLKDIFGQKDIGKNKLLKTYVDKLFF